MGRFLFVVLPLAGHIHAALAVGDALRERGHSVAWCGPESYLRPLVEPGATVYPTGMRYYREHSSDGMAAIQSLWESYLIPFTRFILPAVDRAVVAYRPDVVVTDQHALAGALVAHRHRRLWASLVPGALELTRPLRAVPGAEALIGAQLARLWQLAGLPPDDAVDLRFSPYLVLAFTTSALTGPAALPENCVLVGPALGLRRCDPDFPWRWLRPDRRHILVTVGTLSERMARDFFARTVTALAGLAGRIQAVLLAADGTVPAPPAHVLVTARVPMLRLMPRLDAVVCHAGMGTVGEALAHGVPLVLAPMRHDQPVVAEQVVAAGAGIRVPFAAVTPARLGAAIAAVLDDPAYRAGAGRVRASFTAAGGAAVAAEHLVKLANTTSALP